MKIGPVGFLFLVVGAWAAVRAVIVWPVGEAQHRPRRIAWQPPLLPATDDRTAAVTREAAVALLPVRTVAMAPRIAELPAANKPPKVVLAAAEPPTESSNPRPAVTPIHTPEGSMSGSAPRDRFSLSGWAIVRGQAGPGLASAGQLGGSQAGVRIQYTLGKGIAAALRISGPLRSRIGKEGAVGLDWRPSGRIPVTFSIERRVGLDRGGRDAFALGLFGGVDAVPLRFRANLDAYAQAGLVGLKRRDPYVDGAIRIERSLRSFGKVRLGAGGGLWGGAQPGVSRLDVGPQLVAHVPVAKGSVRIGAEWRERVAGHARPGSGFALSLGADF